MIEYYVGDVIEYQLLGGGIRWVMVDEKHADIKNGLPGFDGTVVLETDESGIAELQARHPELEVGAWGYDDRVIRVVRREGRPS